MPLPVSKIGDWTPTQLERFIADYFETHPPRHLPNVTVGNAKVDGSLSIGGSVGFTADPNFHLISANGEPTFDNGWANWGTPNFNAGYWKDPLGFVHLQGVIKSGTVGSSAFTLPPGLRPSSTAGPFTVLSNGTTGRVDVGSDGTVTPISPSSNVYVSLQGIYFKAA